MTDFSLNTPALLFSAISLFMLAHTNRFLALASLIRQQIERYESDHDENVLKQIENFRRRLKVIKYTQIAGVMSFLCCVISMFLIFVQRPLMAEVLFGASLVMMSLSLLLALHEIFLSIGALKLELKRLKGPEKPGGL